MSEQLSNEAHPSDEVPPRHTSTPRHSTETGSIPVLNNSDPVRSAEAKNQEHESAKTDRFRFFAVLFAAFEESWAEVRVNKVRILFSLFGVLVAVAALATVVGFGGMLNQAIAEQNERYGGRNATLTMNASSQSITKEEYFDKVNELITRYSLTSTTRVGWGSIRVQFTDGVSDVSAELYDREYGLTRRVIMQEGQWFSEADERRLAPAIIVNEAMWNRLGSPNLAHNPTVDMLGDNSGTAVIVGVTPSFGEWDTEPRITMLYDDYVPSTWEAGSFPDYQFWVKPEIVAELQELMNQEMSAFFGSSADDPWMGDGFVQVWRSDPQAYDGGMDAGTQISMVFGGIAIIVLVIGGLGVLNIAMVTIKQRIREIGIRRSFGATSGRIFFSVMMESIVATVFAGILGIIISVILLKNEFLVRQMIQMDLQEMPGYPIEAAVIALIATVVVGALAGIIPALYAVNAKVIDAIRY